MKTLHRMVGFGFRVYGSGFVALLKVRIACMVHWILRDARVPAVCDCPRCCEPACYMTLGIRLQGIDYQQGLQWYTEAPQNLESDAGIFVRSSQMTCAELRKCGRSWATFGVAARLHLTAFFGGADCVQQPCLHAPCRNLKCSILS